MHAAVKHMQLFFDEYGKQEGATSVGYRGN